MFDTLVDHSSRECSLGVWKVHEALSSDRPRSDTYLFKN